MMNPSKILSGKILIVDDVRANIQLLELLLQRAGYLHVNSTADPTSVASLHLKNRYDLIVLDLRMPVMDGFDVMEELKKIETDNYLPVLVVTAQPGQKLRALQAGARDFISKPFDRSEVLTRIHNMLEVRLLNEECNTHNALLEEQVLARTIELRRSEAMFQELATNIPEALWIRDNEQKTIQYVNPAWHSLSGSVAAKGDPLDVVYQTIHPDDLQWVTHERRKSPDDRTSNEFRIVRADQSIRWVHAKSFPIANPTGKTPWIVEIIEDVTQRREAQRELLHLARHDALTGLPNRTLLYESLRDVLDRAANSEQNVSVLLLDIDYFKNVNDTLGHTIGDALLCEVAERLANCVRPGDTVGRLGGDEFAIVILTAGDSHGAIDVAVRIQNALKTPFVLEDQNFLITASIGIATFPTDTSSLETLIRYADAAMYNAKASGRNTFRCYTGEMHARAMAKSDIESALRLALDRGEFVLHYQPKMQIDSGNWTGVEALIRWNRPGQGLALPGVFVPALEEMGLIVPVGAGVIDMACRQIIEWEQAGLGEIKIAVNVSSSQVREGQFVSDVTEILRKRSVDPKLLEFEITESTLMEYGESTSAALRTLKDLGISISIDDFGTGYSNLGYLKRFLVDTLKIDISVIRDVTTNSDDAAIVIAIINMAHSLRLKVVAEGVERQEQLEFLRVHGCDEIQGYLLSKPLPANEIAEKLRRIAPLEAAQWVNSRNSQRSVAHG
jgi:diguanylate cyclase (GGDEF)-like protein/PAS domain S-box-containing protein